MLSRQSRQELEALHAMISATAGAGHKSSVVMSETVETMIIICRREQRPIADDVHAWAMTKRWPGFRGMERSCLRLTESADIVHHTLRLTGQLTPTAKSVRTRLRTIPAA